MIRNLRKTEKNPGLLGRALQSGILSVVALSLLWIGSAAAQDAPATEAANYHYEKQAMRVGVWVDRSEDEVYRRGDDLSVGMQTNGDAYAVVYRIDAEGLVTILWPRTRMDDGFVFGGHEYELPVTGGPRLQVSNEEGLGYVEAVVSSYPFDLRDLEIDFHHERSGKRYDFYVAGDPFLAMNEVNFAVTGLEDAADYVVTNYASYYVHEKVDHPRYLCSQCHFDDDVAYQPYVDHCTLNITSDFGWSNSWYVQYGYYPVYWQPTYVYYDPWTWNPWVNYWYYPSYRWPSYNSYRWNYSAYCWYDSPYYAGDVYYYRERHGHGRYRSLGHLYDGDPRRKQREYGGVSPLVKGKLDDHLRTAMRTRTAIDRKTIRGGAEIAQGLRGERPIVRSRPDLTRSTPVRERPGLRIRGSKGDMNVRPNIRHTAGGSNSRSGVVPVRSKDSRDGTATSGVRGSRSGTRGGATTPTVRSGGSTRGGIRGERPTPQRQGEIHGERSRGSGTIKPVEPRKKGTRVWNRGSGNRRNSESSRGGVRDSRSGDSGRDSGRAVRPTPSKPKRDSGSAVKPSRHKRSSSSNSSSRNDAPKVRSNHNSGSSKSTGGNSRRSGSSSSGSSRKSGGSSKRSGGDSRRR